MAQMDWYYQPVPGLEPAYTKTNYVAGLYRTTPPNGTEPKIDLAFGGGPSMHRPTSPVASNPGRSHPLNVAGFSPPIPDTAPAIVFHCT